MEEEKDASSGRGILPSEAPSLMIENSKGVEQMQAFIFKAPVARPAKKRYSEKPKTCKICGDSVKENKGRHWKEKHPERMHELPQWLNKGQTIKDVEEPDFNEKRARKKPRRKYFTMSDVGS